MAELRLQLDEDLLERLRQRARARGVSFERYLLDRLREFGHPGTKAEALDRARAIRSRSVTPAAGLPDAERMIREDRDAR